METIIIGFSKPKKWKPFAKLIMFAYKTPYDHVYLKFNSTMYNRQIIYQASKLMVNFAGVSVFESENIVVKEFTIEIDSSEKIKLMQFLIDNAGKPYSIKEIIGLAWVKFNKFFNKQIENPFKTGNDSYVCSTIISYVLNNFSYVKNIIDYEDMSPEDVYKLLEKGQI